MLRPTPLLRPLGARTLTLASHAYLPPGPKPGAFSGPPPTAGAGPNASAPPNAPAGIPHASVASPPSIPRASAPPPARPNPATTESPDLSADERRLIEEIVRVDHAGELGANWIYRGQKWACQMRGDRATAGQVEVSREPVRAGERVEFLL